MKIVLTDAKTVFDELVTPAPLRELGEVDEYGLLKYDDVAEKIADADVVVVNKTILDSYTLRLAKKLKYIGLFATGYNNIDIKYCREHGISFQEHTAFNDKIIADADIIYMTRVQKERFSDLMEYERVKNVYILHNNMLANARENMRILHPLPRVNEIDYDVDENPHAYYIQQAKNGLYARQAIFAYCLGISLEEVRNDTTII